MAISRSQMGKQVRNGPVKKVRNKRLITLPPGVKCRPKTMTKVMLRARRHS